MIRMKYRSNRLHWELIESDHSVGSGRLVFVLFLQLHLSEQNIRDRGTQVIVGRVGAVKTADFN